MLNSYFWKYKVIKKAACIGVIVAFFMSFIYADAKPAVEIGAVGYEIPGDEAGLGAQFKTDTFTVPAHLGEVKHKFGTASNRFIIHIQDAHCNYFAQRKIYDIIDYLNSEYGISMINLEGGVGDYDLTPFTSITNGTVRREVSEYFAKKGEINGAELYAVNNPGKITLWGVEDKDLYLANLDVYRDFLSYKAESEKYLGELTHILENLKRHIYTPELFKIDKAYNSYKAGKMEFRDYLEFLTKGAEENNIQITRFKNLALLLQAMRQEDDVDFKKANMERNELIDRLKKKLSKQEISELVLMSMDFKTKKISRKEFYGYLLKKARDLKFDLKRFPALSSYIEYISSYEAVDRSRVVKELDELETEIKERLYRNDTERRLNILSRNLAILKNIFAFSLTKSDYRYYLDNKGSFDIANYVEFIRKESPRYKISAALSPDIVNMDDYRERIMVFYDYSFKRDEVFLENMRFDTLSGGAKGAVLMTGGFHTENLRELFEKEDIQYVSILPSFTSKKGYQSPYFNLLAGEGTGMEEMLRTIIAQVSMLQVASNLNELGGDAFGRANIESFRAAVAIQTLVQQGYQVTVTDTEGGVLFTEGEGAPITMNIWELLDLVHERDIDKPIADAFERGDARTLEEEGLEAARGMARTFLEDTAAALSALGYTEEAAKVMGAVDALGDVQINLLANVEGFVGHAGGRGIHINRSAVTGDEGINTEKLAGCIVHEVVAAFAREHGISSVLEEMFLGTSDVTDSNLAEILQGDWYLPVWDIASREARLAGGRDFAFREIDPIERMAAERLRYYSNQELGGDYEELERGFLAALEDIVGHRVFTQCVITDPLQPGLLKDYRIGTLKSMVRNLKPEHKTKFAGYKINGIPISGITAESEIRIESVAGKLRPVIASRAVRTHLDDNTGMLYLNLDDWGTIVEGLEAKELGAVEAEGVALGVALRQVALGFQPDLDPGIADMFIYREIAGAFIEKARQVLENIIRAAETIKNNTHGDVSSVIAIIEPAGIASRSIGVAYREYVGGESKTIEEQCTGIAGFIGSNIIKERFRVLTDKLDELKKSENAAFRFFAEESASSIDSIIELAGEFKAASIDTGNATTRLNSAVKAVSSAASAKAPWETMARITEETSRKADDTDSINVKERSANDLALYRPWDNNITEVMTRMLGDNKTVTAIVNRAIEESTRNWMLKRLEWGKLEVAAGYKERVNEVPIYNVVDNGTGEKYELAVYTQGDERQEREFRALEAAYRRLGGLLGPAVMLPDLELVKMVRDVKVTEKVRAIILPRKPEERVAISAAGALEAIPRSIERMKAEADESYKAYNAAIKALDKEIKDLQKSLDKEQKKKPEKRNEREIERLKRLLEKAESDREKKQNVRDATTKRIEAGTRGDLEKQIKDQVNELRKKIKDAGVTFPDIDNDELFGKRCGFLVADTEKLDFAGLILFDLKGMMPATESEAIDRAEAVSEAVNQLFPGAERVSEIMYRALLSKAGPKVTGDEEVDAENTKKYGEIINGVKRGQPNADVEAIIEATGEVPDGFWHIASDIMARTDFAIPSATPVAAKVPGTDMPDLGRERLIEIAGEARTRGDVKTFEFDSAEVRGATGRLRAMAAGIDEARPMIPEDIGIGNVEIVVYDLADKVEAMSYADEDGTLVIVLNSDKGKSDDYFADTEALEHLIRHEFLEANGLAHRVIKELEMIENGRNALTVLNRIALKHMTLEQLGNIEEEHELDPGARFYAAAGAEIEARHARSILEIARPAPCAILLPLTEDQKITDGSAFRRVASDTERSIDKKYGTNISIYYYDPAADPADKTSLSNVSEKAMLDRVFQRNEGARLLAYVPDSFMSEADIESFKGSMETRDDKEKFAGVVKENIEEGDTYDEVLHTVLGLGLIDYSKAPSPEMEDRIKSLLSIMVEAGEVDSINDMDLNELLKGVVLLRLKKIDYGEIKDWKDAQDEVLRAL